MSTIMDVSIETALTMLCVALGTCRTDEDKQAARVAIFESAEGSIALEQLEDVLGLFVTDNRDEVVRGFDPAALQGRSIERPYM